MSNDDRDVYTCVPIPNHLFLVTPERIFEWGPCSAWTRDRIRAVFDRWGKTACTLEDLETALKASYTPTTDENGCQDYHNDERAALCWILRNMIWDAFNSGEYAPMACSCGCSPLDVVLDDLKLLREGRRLGRVPDRDPRKKQ